MAHMLKNGLRGFSCSRGHGVFWSHAGGPYWAHRERQGTAASIPSCLFSYASGFLSEGIHWFALKETPGTNCAMYSIETQWKANWEVMVFICVDPPFFQVKKF